MAEITDLSDLAEGLAPGARLLGLDVGTKTIGLALSDVRLQIASPLETLKKGKLAGDVAALQAVLARHGVGGLVIGLPLNMDGTDGPRAQSVRAFARNIAGHLPTPIAFWDERMSTQAVTRALLEADASRARRAVLVDKLAAAYILQGALDRLTRRTAF